MKKMKKLNRKGFTLIELLAVITIMGILLLVAIPAISRTIENSRRDTFVDISKTYINAVRNAVLADEMTCGTKGSVASVENGTYYYKIESTSTGTQDLMQSGGLSPWGNSKVKGYVVWQKDESNGRTDLTFKIFLVDAGKHGIETENGELESDLTRADVKTETTKSASDTLTYPTGTECTLN